MTSPANPPTAQPPIEEMSEFDLLVVGAGATGCGIALDAASRGLRTLVVEREDIASGTSSLSSKLIHGGLRYLESLEISLVAEALAERAILQRNAPGLVSPLNFTIPIFSRSAALGKARLALYSATLWGYDLAGSLRSAGVHRRIGPKEVLQNLPAIKQRNLRGGMIYPDAFADDARLVLSVALTAKNYFGAEILTRHSLTRLRRLEGGTFEAEITSMSPTSPAKSQTVKVAAVVVAAGVDAASVSNEIERPSKTNIVAAKGVHLCVKSQRLTVVGAAAIDVESDKRRIFIVSWGNYTYFGTTDTEYSGDRHAPQIDKADVDYLLAAVNAAFSLELSAKDLTGGWAGLRPLISPSTDAPTTKISRKHHLEELEPGVFLLSGGKLTTYRKMAQDATDAICAHLKVEAKCQTKRIGLWGALTPPQSHDLTPKIENALKEINVQRLSPAQGAAILVGRYGSQALLASQHVVASGELAEVYTGSGILRGEPTYMATSEMAQTPLDVVLRRSRIGILDFDIALKSIPAIAEELRALYGWDEEAVRHHIADAIAPLTMPV